VVRGFLEVVVLQGARGDDRGGLELLGLYQLLEARVTARTILFPSFSVRSEGGFTSEVLWDCGWTDDNGDPLSNQTPSKVRSSRTWANRFLPKLLNDCEPVARGGGITA
jgi:hypothetical protein